MNTHTPIHTLLTKALKRSLLFSPGLHWTWSRDAAGIPRWSAEDALAAELPVPQAASLRACSYTEPVHRRLLVSLESLVYFNFSPVNRF